MSFLAGRLAGKEAAYFFEESKHVVTRFVEKNPKLKTPHSQLITPTSNPVGESPDVLPEILRHSLPSKMYRGQTLSEFESEFTSPKWALPKSEAGPYRVSVDVMNPLRAYVSLPQVSFGAKRWQLPTAESSVIASTANDLRSSDYTQVNPEKVRAAAEGLTQIGMAFAAGTAVIFGSAVLILGLAASKLDIHSVDDIRAKGKDLLHPTLENMKEGLHPLRDWADKKSLEWRFNNEHDINEKSIIKELSKRLGAKSSS